MGFGDKLKGLRDQAQQAVADNKDKIHGAVQSAGDAANARTKGKYADHIAKVGEKVSAGVEKFGAGAGDPGSSDPGTSGPGSDAGTSGPGSDAGTSGPGSDAGTSGPGAGDPGAYHVPTAPETPEAPDEVTLPDASAEEAAEDAPAGSPPEFE